MYASYHLSHCDTTTRNYVNGEEGKCRRELICSYFMEKAKQMTPKHNCCDLCDNECDCEECEEPQKEDFAEKPRNLCQRTVDDSEKTLLEETLKSLQKEYRKRSVLGSGTLTALNDCLLQDLVNNFDSIFTVQYLMENFPIFDKCLAQEIITVFSDVFGDISEYEFCDSMLGSLDLGCEEDFYTDVPDWCTEPCTDSEPSDEEVQIDKFKF